MISSKILWAVEHQLNGNTYRATTYDVTPEDAPERSVTLTRWERIKANSNQLTIFENE